MLSAEIMRKFHFQPGQVQNPLCVGHWEWPQQGAINLHRAAASLEGGPVATLWQEVAVKAPRTSHPSSTVVASLAVTAEAKHRHFWQLKDLLFLFLIYVAPHHLVVACLPIEQLLKICGDDSDHADPRPETVGQPRIDDLAEILCPDHPGGAAVLLRHAGQDATEAFLSVGHSQEAWTLLSRLPVVTGGVTSRRSMEYSTVEPPGTQDLAMQFLHLAAACLLTFLPRFMVDDSAAPMQAPDLRGSAVPSAALGLAVIGLAVQLLPFSPPWQVPSVRQGLQGVSILILALFSLLPLRVLSLAAAFASGILNYEASGRLWQVLSWTFLLQAGPLASTADCSETTAGLLVSLQRIGLGGLGAGALLGLWERQQGLKFADAAAAALAALRVAGILSLVSWLLLLLTGQVHFEVVAAARCSGTGLLLGLVKVLVM
eukprot:s917_g10.t1